MSNKKITFYYLLIIVKLIFCFNTGKESSIFYLSSNNTFNYNSINNFVVFGDSHSHQGTNFTTMEPSKKLIDYQKNWPLYLSDIHKMKLWNYAIPGGVADLNITYNDFCNKNKLYKCDLKSQYEMFYNNMSNGRKFYSNWNSDNTIFGIYIGSVDVHLAQFMKKDITVFQIIDRVVDAIINIAKKLYDTGAKNFIFMNVSPLENAPANTSGKHDYYKVNIPYFNEILNKQLEIFFNTYNNTNLIIYNLHNEYKYILNNYKKFEFISEKDGWFNNKDIDQNKYFWRDNTHITNKANEIIARDINDLLMYLSKNS